MLMLLSSSSTAYANEEVVASDVGIDIELLEFLGDIAGLESLGLDIDSMLELDDQPNSWQALGGTNNEN